MLGDTPPAHQRLRRATAQDLVRLLRIYVENRVAEGVNMEYVSNEYASAPLRPWQRQAHKIGRLNWRSQLTQRDACGQIAHCGSEDVASVKRRARRGQLIVWIIE